MELRADLDPRELRAFASGRLAAAGAARDAFLARDERTPALALLAAFDAIRRPLDEISGRAQLLSQTHPAQPVREAAREVLQDLSAFDTDLSLDRRVYDRLRAIPPSVLAGPVDRRLLEHALRDYRRSGVDRDEGTRARIKALTEELVREGQTFDANIARDTRTLVLSEGPLALEGLPEDYIAAHPPAENGAVTITTDPSDYVPFLTYARRGDLRRELYLAYTNRAAPENLDVLRRILSLRHELAGLLGYPSWADYVTEDKMIRTAGAVREFVQRVAHLARARLESEVAELLEEKRREEPGAVAIHDWERAYWAERVKARKFSFDSQALRPYFPFERVRDGVLATSAGLYGIEFRRDAGQPVWHETVECYDVLEGGERIARIYLDLHPRPDKYKHAALFDLRSGLEGECLPEAALVCNYPLPRNGDPALLLHQDVTSLFHEFGHLLHHLFAGTQRYLAFSGIATEWDFVEVPSQLYEEWAWDPGVLERFARHHRTAAPIPASLVAQLRRAEEHGKGVHVSMQMLYAALSLSLHERDPSGLDPMAVLVELKRRLLPFPHEPGSRFLASFGHLNGYSAIYYTYMWSLVIAKDLLSGFEGSLKSAANAQRYRQAILAPGGSRDAAELVRQFLGRDYADSAWERWLYAGAAPSVALADAGAGKAP